jgi:hypothetical protein
VLGMVLSQANIVGGYTIQNTTSKWWFNSCLILSYVPLELPGLVIVALIVDKVGWKFSMALLFFTSCSFLVPLIFDSEVTTSISLFGAHVGISASSIILSIYAPEVSTLYIYLIEKVSGSTSSSIYLHE